MRTPQRDGAGAMRKHRALSFPRFQGRVGAGGSRVSQASLTARLQLLLRRRIGPVHGASASGADDIGSRGAWAAGWQDCCVSCMWEWLGLWHGGRGSPLLDQLGRGLPVHPSCAQGRIDSNVYMTRGGENTTDMPHHGYASELGSEG